MSKRHLQHLTRKRGLYLLVALCLATLLVACAPEATPPAAVSTPTPLPVPQEIPLPAAPSPSPATAAPVTPVPTPATPTPAPVIPVPLPATTTPAIKGPPGYVTPEAVNSSDITFTSDRFDIKGYLSRPKSSGTFPGLIIIHENRGRTEHMEDVARRFANQDYVALAPDLLSRLGGTAKFATAEDAVTAIGTLSQEGIISDLNSAVKYLQSLPYVRKDSIGVIGYCWGGGNSLLFATRSPDLRAAVVYYGPNPSNLDDVANVTAAVLGIYGAEDVRITVNAPRLDEAMKKYGKSFEYKVFPGAAHAFFNDTGARYSPEASAEAWPLTLSFLEKHLKTGSR